MEWCGAGTDGDGCGCNAIDSHDAVLELATQSCPLLPSGLYLCILLCGLDGPQRLPWA